MAHPHGLVIQNATINANPATLAAQAVLTIDSSFSATTATFLMKRVRFMLQWDTIDNVDDGPLLVGLARGDATAAEIAGALTTANTSGPLDTTQVLLQDRAFVIVQKALRMFRKWGGATAATDNGSAEAAYDFKLPGRGVSFAEGAGWQSFIFNAGNGALATGSTVGGLCQYWGVWLRD